MRVSLAILIFFTACTAAKESSITVASRASVVGGSDSVKWFTGNESAVKKYLVEYGTDTFNYSTLATILPGKNIYTVPLPDSTIWIRIHATGYADFYLPARLHTVAKNSVLITNAIYGSTTLKWTVSNAIRVKSFLIEKSTNGISWSKTTEWPFDGAGNYTYRYSRTVRKYQYRISAIFLDGTKGTTTSFK